VSDATDKSIACSEILLRGIRWKHLEWDEEAADVTVRSDAFIRQRRPDGTVDSDLSVDRLRYSTVEQSFARWGTLFTKGKLTGMPVARSLHTGWLRDLGLRVLASPTPENPAHAGIHGLPEPPPPNDSGRLQATAASRMATKLLLLSRFAGYGRDDVREQIRRRHQHATAGLLPPVARDRDDPPPPE